MDVSLLNTTAFPLHGPSQVHGAAAVQSRRTPRFESTKAASGLQFLNACKTQNLTPNLTPSDSLQRTTAYRNYQKLLHSQEISLIVKTCKEKEGRTLLKIEL